MKKKNKKFDLLILFSIILLCIGYAIKTFQNDTFYTISIGKDILKYGVDMLDHFSIHNLSYTYPHWLYDLCVYLIYSKFGFTGLYIVLIFIYIAIGLLLYFLTNNLFKNKFISGISSIIGVICLNGFIAVRAQSITYILFILELYIIEKYLLSSNKKYLIFLPIISLLIVNLHCAVWIFFFILFLPALAEGILSWYKNKNIKIKKINKPSGKYLPCKSNINIFNDKIRIDNDAKIKYLFLVMIICIFTGFITLNGLTPFTYIFKTLQGNSLGWIGEHQAPVLRYNTNLIFYLCLTILILVFSKNRMKLRDLFLLIGLFMLSFYSYRQISLLIVCGTFPLVRFISEVLSKNENLSLSFIKVFTKRIIFIVLIVLVFLLSFSSYYGEKIYKQKFVDDELYPVQASNYILENLDYKNIRMYNEYNYGSYLLYRGIPVFVDSRCDLYMPEFSNLERSITDDYLDMGLNYKEIIEYYNLTHVMIYRYNEKYKKSTLYEIFSLDDDYKIIYEDDYFAIFEVLKK